MPEPQAVVVNENAYKPGPIHRVVKLEVEVMLDAVPGAWHQPEDIMNWIAEHSYVQKVTLTGEIETDVEPWEDDDASV